MSNSLQPHESQHTRPPCLSPTPRVYSNTSPLSQWCHPAISSSVVPFSCPLSASGSFPMSQLFTWSGQSIWVSASASVLPMNTQDWSALRWTGLISLQSKGLSRVFSNTTVQKHLWIACNKWAEKVGSQEVDRNKNWGAFWVRQFPSQVRQCVKSMVLGCRICGTLTTVWSTAGQLLPAVRDRGSKMGFKTKNKVLSHILIHR